MQNELINDLETEINFKLEIMCTTKSNRMSMIFDGIWQGNKIRTYLYYIQSHNIDIVYRYQKLQCMYIIQFSSEFLCGFSPSELVSTANEIMQFYNVWKKKQKTKILFKNVRQSFGSFWCTKYNTNAAMIIINLRWNHNII